MQLAFARMTHIWEVFRMDPTALITHNGISGQVEKGEWGSGGWAPRKIFASHVLQIARERLLSFVI